MMDRDRDRQDEDAEGDLDQDDVVTTIISADQV